MLSRIYTSLTIGVVILLLSSCATQTRVVTEYRDRIVNHTEIQRDSIFVHDSVSVDRGRDTILVERWHYEYRTITSDKGDTLILRDSIPYEVEVVKEVRVRNGYDKFTARGFWIYTLLVVLAIVVWIGKKTPYGKMAWLAIKSAITWL